MILSAAGLAGSVGAPDVKDHGRHKSETRACCLSTCIVSLAQLRFLRGDQDPGVSLLVTSLVWVAPLDSSGSTPYACIVCLMCRVRTEGLLLTGRSLRTKAIRRMAQGYGYINNATPG